MSDRLIAIVGSADLGRTDYVPPLKSGAQVHKAAEALGRELANANYDIVVFASNANWSEWLPSDTTSPVSTTKAIVPTSFSNRTIRSIMSCHSPSARAR